MSLGKKGFCLDISTWVSGPTTAVGLCAIRMSAEILSYAKTLDFEVEFFSRRPLSKGMKQRLVQLLGLERVEELKFAPKIRRFVCAFKGQVFVSFDHRLVPVYGAKKIVFVHDCWTMRDNPWQSKEFMSVQRPKILKALADSDLILCPSEVVAGELSAFTRKATSQIHVLPWGPMVSCELGHEAFDSKTLLMIGTFETRKNHRLAFELAKKLGSSWRWIFVGSSGFGSNRIEKGLEELRASDFQVTTLSKLSESEMKNVYKSAFAVLCPSFEEGFGLTVLESITIGRPVWASKISSHVEIGDQAIEYFDPLASDLDQLASKILDASRNQLRYQNLVLAGHKQAQKFSWKTSGTKFMNFALPLMSNQTHK